MSNKNTFLRIRYFAILEYYFMLRRKLNSKLLVVTLRKHFDQQPIVPVITSNVRISYKKSVKKNTNLDSV